MEKDATKAQEERKGFIESVVEDLWDTRNTEVLQVLPTKEESEIQLVERAGLSSFSPFNLMLAGGLLLIVYIIFRKVKDASHEAHGETTVDTEVADEEKLQKALQEKKRFLEVYPQMKQELEERIRKLHTLADKIDKVHKGCTITQVVAKSTCAVSGVLTILGLTLAPVTAGFSLGLLASGLGLWGAAAVTSASAKIVEEVNMELAEAEASQLLPRSNNTENDIKSNNTEKDITESLEKITSRLVSVSKQFVKNVDDIKKNIDAIKLEKASPRLANKAKRLMTTGKVSAKSTKEVKKAFGGTVLAMTKRARIMGAATAGHSLALDIVSIIKDTKHLQNGAKAESAAKLRQQAQELEQKLQELIQVHDILTQ
ncbi:apolipoprotein L6-like [Chionomys nivalis]|uniref:apolipoprotein L6-like n=1 Tax=Chionomys nivalis TaxID=269649 RepID=UPI002599636E|nr:apolipoprotein L6-like [Chionomys nivalis]